MANRPPRHRVALLLAVLPLLAGCGAWWRPSAPPPPTVPKVDLPRYMGTWHEIAKYPNRFQRGCDGATATYALRPDGRVDVTNRCVEDGNGGEVRSVRGVARVVDRESGAKLSVTFFWPFAGDYWILALGERYEHAVVGSPDRKYLWILARDPVMDEGSYGRILEEVRRLGFEPERLVRAVRRGAGAP